MGRKPANLTRIHQTRYTLVPGRRCSIGALLGLPGLKAVSRYQLALAILMFIGSPAWIGMLVLGALHWPLLRRPRILSNGRGHSAVRLRVSDVVLAEDCERDRYSASTGVLSRARRPPPCCQLRHRNRVSILLCPILWFGHTIFLAGLLFGREIGWIGQIRDDHAVPFSLALRSLWPHMLLGCANLRNLWQRHIRAQSHTYCFWLGGLRRNPIRNDDRVAFSWRSVGPYRNWWAAGDDHSGRTAGPGAARVRDGGAVATAKFGLTRCSKH